MSEIADITNLVKEKCLQYFDSCGIVKAEILKKEAEFLKQWLNNDYHDQMNYMTKNFQKRINPKELVDYTKSIIVVLQNYYPPEKQKKTKYWISKYAYGIDYHYVIKKKLYQLYEELKQEVGDFRARAFVDSAPVLEKALAQKAGLGWIGKNTLLITKKGSYFFIGELFTDLELSPDKPAKNYCGACTRCIDACPTNAIVKPFVLDSRKCISNITIERRPPIPEQFKGKYKNWIFGCDICQDVCPWNNKATPTTETDLQPNNLLLQLTDYDWENLTKSTFKKIFKNSAVRRRKYEGLKHNIEFLKNQN